MTKKVFVLAAGVILLGLAGCTSVSTEPDQAAVQYEGGPLSSKKYGSYVGPAKREWFGPGDKTYVYPLGQRSFDATGGNGAERPPITSSSKDNVELATPVSVTFELRSDDENVLREFHERIGLKYQAFAGDNDEGEDTSKGWKRMLDFYIGQPLETTVDRVLAGPTWQQSYGDPAVRVQIEAAVKAELPALVKQKMGGDYFENFAVLVQRPTPTNEELRNNIAAAQNQVAQAQAAKAKAEADLAATKAQVAVSQAEAAKRKAEISAYGSVDEYNKSQAIAKGINPYQPTYVVSGTAPGNR